MELLNLEIENFMAIKKAELKNLDSMGLTLIQGDNKIDPSANSNGAGKSTIADSICWALYGVTARDSKGDEVVNRATKKNTLVSVKLNDNGTVYEITRHRKHSKGKNAVHVRKESPNGWGDITGGTDKLTQEIINKIMGCSVDVFAASIYAGQESFPDLPGMTDKVLKMIVEEAAGVDRLQAAHDEAKKRHTDAKNLLQQYEHCRQHHADKFHFFDSEKQAAKTDLDKWEADHKQQIEALDQQLKALAQKRDEEAAKLRAVDLAAIDAELDAIKQKIAGVESEHKTRNDLVRKENDALLHEAQIKQQLMTAAQAAKSDDALVKSVDSRIGQPCGECGRAHDESTLGAAKTNAQHNLNQQMIEVGRLQAEMQKANQQLSEASQALQDFTSTMTDVSAETQRQSELMQSKSSAAQLLTVVKATVQQLQDKTNEVAQARAATNPHANRMSEINNREREAQAEIDKIDAELPKLKDRVTVAETAVQVFSPAGVRAHILDHVTPLLNERTHHYLSTLSDGNLSAAWSTLGTLKGGGVREKFNITVNHASGGETFKSLSGGEKRKVRLATAMALQDLVASRATKPINFFLADEIDDALDVAGLERLMTLLEQKAREKGSVLVISHSDLRDWICNVITVTKTEEGSVVTA